MVEEILNQMPTDERAAYVTLEANYLGYRMMGVFVVKLYHLNDFFVEIYFNTAKNELAWIKTFSSADYLAPYLENIKIRF